MAQWFMDLHPVVQALLAGLFTWGLTALGAASVFFTRSVNRRLLSGMLGFSGGVMIAASFWSLLSPALEITANDPQPTWMPAFLPAAIGFLLGGGCIWVIDRILPHLHLGLPREQAEGPSTTWRRSILLVTAITMHNFPEGLAVGVAFGGVVAGETVMEIGPAIALAIGIGIQNFPEGIAVALPLRGEGVSKLRSFGWGQLSAVVEPIAAMIGAVAVVYAAPILPYALAFAAGAMIYVVVEELIPEAERSGHVDLATIWLMIGFTVMMILDVALG